MRNFHSVDTSGSIAATNAVGAAAVLLNDRHVKRQWYLDVSKNSPFNINVAEVWADYSGKGVKVGVIDTQIDFRHTDLAKAYDATLDYNFTLGTANVAIDPAKLPNYHGTFVAGIISAEQNNGIGTAGIAPGATLVGLAVDYTSNDSVEQIVQALNRAVLVDVVNNSWRFNASFDDNFRSHPEYEAALVNVVSNGRGGLGTSIVFAAGNTGYTGTANYNNFQNSPYTIAVGAVDANGNASSFTSIGANVLLSAAGRDIYSTDLGDTYDTGMGTSFAAPQVTAAIALMLEANPLLGYRDVQEILALSATRKGLTENKLYGDGWQTNGATNYNGGGMHFSDLYGYGFLDVHAAVRIAESWTQQQTFSNMTEIAKKVAVNQTLVAGSNDRISVDVVVDKAISVEHVQLMLDMVWLDSGNIDIFLTSPDGTTVRLVYDLPNIDRVGSIRNFEFSSVASMGEMASGTWRIDIVNNNPGAVGKAGAAMSGLVRELTLTVQGNAAGLADDTYFYTDEFAGLYVGDDLAARKVLRDTDGGNDTINAAAVTTASVFDLSGASITRIGGQVVTISANTIENAVGGDGNDTFVGSSAANIFKGGRGTDTFRFSAGNDLIDGQQGSDTLFVGSAFAAVSGYVTTIGEIALSSASGTISIIRNVEIFAFTDITYSFDQIVTLLAGQPSGGGGTGLGEDAGGSGPGGSPGEGGGGNGDTGGGEPGGSVRTFEKTFAGGAGADTHGGTNATDLIYGKAGNDKLSGRNGNDDIYGEDGDDSLGGGKGDDYIYGGAGKDQLLGNADDDRLYGGDDADSLSGMVGDDILQGGRGADRLSGGIGSDTFVFDFADIDALDIVLDFDIVEGDQILITGLSDSSASNLSFVERKGFTILGLQTSHGLVEIARIQGIGLGDLSLQVSEEGMLFA